MLVNDAPMAMVSLIDHRTNNEREREGNVCCVLLHFFFRYWRPSWGPLEFDGRGRRSERDVAVAFNDSATRYVVIKVFTTPVCFKPD